MLGKAMELLPNRKRIRYHHALVLQHLGRRADAEAALLKGNQMDPRSPDTLHALAIFYIQGQQWEKAFPFAQNMLELLPGAPGPKQLLQQIREHVDDNEKRQ